MSTDDLPRIVGDVVTVIKGSIEVWPTPIEIRYFEEARRGLPRIAVDNPRAGRESVPRALPWRAAGVSPLSGGPGAGETTAG